MVIDFVTPTNVAFESLGALPPGQHWSRFDVPGEEAATGHAKVLVTTIWNNHWSRLGSRRVAKEPAIYRDVNDGSLWYRMGRPGPGASRTHVAHWNRLMLARDQGVRILGVLKDYSTSRCSLRHTFQCTGVVDDISADSVWIGLQPDQPLSINFKDVDIRKHLGVAPDPARRDETPRLIEAVIRPQNSRDGQSLLADAQRRRAIELHAMKLAIEHYEGTWPNVQDVSARESFDLLCRNGQHELRVEVKGTSTRGGKILLTRNEVNHASNSANPVALFVVSEIHVDAENRCSGGVPSVHEPWQLDIGRLEPIAFEYEL